ncbi:MAG: L,D-transpeptidase [Patescibacteria group bacterium]|nr:L,D-transpeptidase [Patescibacteria group bacterium]
MRNGSNKILLAIFLLSVFSLSVFAILPGLNRLSKKNAGTVCANSLSCLGNLTGKYEASPKEGVFEGIEVDVPKEIAAVKPPPVLGESSAPNKHIYVDLTHQMLYAKEGDREVFSFPISSGKWYPTPTGDFRIWIKLRYTRMTGGNPAIHTYYDLPNVPFTMYFYNDEISKWRGFGLHGAYWHNNFGHPMSHGCINISIPNAEKLYNWADPPTAGNVTYAADNNLGTPLTIYGVTPRE